MLNPDYCYCESDGYLYLGDTFLFHLYMAAQTRIWVLFFLHRCKLFYKKDNEFKEKGVGTLHLKPAGNEKTQLLVRADTNLGKYIYPSNKSWCQNSLLSIRIFFGFVTQH